MQYWLVKSEPEVYSIDHLSKDKITLWENIRNYQARNYMTNGMQVGDLAFFYHSNSKPSGVAGVVEISGAARPDPSQFDKKSEYFDPKATTAKPIWFCVEVKFKEKLKRLVSLEELKAQSSLKNMILLNNSRLSVQPVTKNEFQAIVKMSSQKEKT